MACFEPALDYVVIKIPRWDLKKFSKVSKKIGWEMKSVGEVMAIGRKFEEALQKALRMLHIGMYGLVCNELQFEDLNDELKNPTDQRIFALPYAFNAEYSIDKIHKLSCPVCCNVVPTYVFLNFFLDLNRQFVHTNSIISTLLLAPAFLSPCLLRSVQGIRAS